MLNLDSVLSDMLIPWSRMAEGRIICARPQMHISHLPSDVRLEKRSLTGKRVIVRNKCYYHNTRTMTAFWPDRRISEVQLLKLACVLSGHVDYQLGKQAVLCGPGHFIVIPPGTPHPEGPQNIIDTTCCDQGEVLYFHLYPTALQCWISQYHKNNKRLSLGNYLFLHPHLIQLFRMLMEEIIADETSPSMVGQELLQAFFHLLQVKVQQGLFQKVRSGEVAPETANRAYENDFLKAVYQYIEIHLQGKPKLEEAARHLCLSRSQFAHRLRAESGKTFIELVNEHRIETAKQLLSNSDWTITTIASFIGYETPHYFQSLFLRRVGTTPGQYRQQMQKEAR